MLEEHEVGMVINISRSRAADTVDADYASRRAAVDFGIPVRKAYLLQGPADRQLINNAKLAVLFTETLQKKFHRSPLPYVEGTNPPEVKSWREFVPNSTA